MAALKNSNHCKPANFFALGAIACCVLFSGCASVASVQDWRFKHANKARAHDTYHDCYNREQRKANGADFEAGYLAGFVDSSTGVDCLVPAVPPPKYWSAKYQCCDGQACIQNWFLGFQRGVAAAESCGYSAFHEVPTSPCAPTLNKTACGTCYSPDPCNCKTPVNVGYPVENISLPAVPNFSAIQATPSIDSGVRAASASLIGPSDFSAANDLVPRVPRSPQIPR